MRLAQGPSAENRRGPNGAPLKSGAHLVESEPVAVEKLAAAPLDRNQTRVIPGTAR